MPRHLVIIAHITEIVFTLVLALRFRFGAKVLRLSKTLAVFCRIERQRVE